jgi:hypothetical protein
MFQVVEELNVSPAPVSYVNTEVAGQLRGMSQEAIFNSWVAASQIGGVMGQLRERSKEEVRKRPLAVKPNRHARARTSAMGH